MAATSRRPESVLAIPPGRRKALADLRAILETTGRVVLTTHINADGDGIGSEAALARFLIRGGARVTLVNPTPVPDTLAFLVEDLEAHSPTDPEGERALREADLLLLLDTSEASRLGVVAGRLETTRVAVVDHHPPSDESYAEVVVRDTSACATGELIYDLLTLRGDALAEEDAVGLYVAIVTDTGSFRFSNTSPRAHALAAHLIATGVDPADLYRRLYAQHTPARLKLIRSVLDSLVVDDECRIAWVTITHVALRDAGARSDDAEGLVEYPRRIKGVEVAILMREVSAARTKASLRSNGRLDVSALAQQLGGGGHPKAAGVLLELPLPEATDLVVETVRAAVRGMEEAGVRDLQHEADAEGAEA
jgi:phosphoesterase RecJ-like protein